jgi:hypothetical protein
MATMPTIVLVHGAWADGSSWSAVVERLQADGYTGAPPQATPGANPRLESTTFEEWFSTSHPKA